MKRLAVATASKNGNKIKPHEIVSGDRLDGADMETFKRVVASRQQAEQLAQQAQAAAIAAQGITQFFMEGIKGKYGLSVKDEIQPDGTIVRVASAEIVE